MYVHVLCYHVGPSGSLIQMYYTIVWAHIYIHIYYTIVWAHICLHVLCHSMDQYLHIYYTMLAYIVLSQTGWSGKADPGSDLLMYIQGSPRVLFCGYEPWLQNKGLGDPWLCIKRSELGSAFPDRPV
jgi:hypothetical protein